MTTPHQPKGIHSRGYLPHIDGANYQIITYRLNDALPQALMHRLQSLPERHRRQQTETALDSGYGSCWLAQPEVAAIVIENWQYFDNSRYQLIAWVIMPNHVHILIQIPDGESLSRIVQSWKSYIYQQTNHPMAGKCGPAARAPGKQCSNHLAAGLLGSLHPQRSPLSASHRIHSPKPGESRVGLGTSAMAMEQRGTRQNIAHHPGMPAPEPHQPNDAPTGSASHRAASTKRCTGRERGPALP